MIARDNPRLPTNITSVLPTATGQNRAIDLDAINDLNAKNVRNVLNVGNVGNVGVAPDMWRCVTTKLGHMESREMHQFLKEKVVDAM